MTEHTNIKKKLNQLFDVELYSKLNSYSFKNIDECYKLIKKLYKLCDDFYVDLPEVLEFLSVSGCIDKALEGFILLIEKSKNRQKLIKYIISNPLFAKLVPQILILPYVNKILILEPDWLYWLLDQDLHNIKSSDDYLEELKSFKCKNKSNKYHYIGLYKNRETFRIAVRELLGEDYSKIEKELSNLAEACFKTAYDIVNEKYKKQYGSIDNIGLAIIALERLGACELCYNDDVSVLVIYSDSDKKNVNGSKLSAYNYYTNFTRQLIEIIDKNNIYRLSYPTRSKRDKTPKVYTIDEYISKLENNIAVFERFQLIKARFCCGDVKLGNTFLTHANVITYRKYLSLDDIYKIKDLIGNFSHSKVVKLKDIEIMIQMIQLFHGGKVHNIQTQNTLNAINKLYCTGLLNKSEKNILEDGYHFFKLLKHETQLFDKEQCKSLMTNKKLLKTIAKNLGYLPKTDKDAGTLFKDYYNNISYELLKTLKNYFRALVRIKNPSFLYLLNHKPKLIQHFIARYQFKDTKNAFNMIKELAPSTQKGSEAFINILPIFLEEIKNSPDKDLLLINFSKAIKSYNLKDGLFEFFNYNRKIVCYLSKVFSNSEFLSEILIQHPELFEDITKKDFFEYKYSFANLQRDLNQILKFKSFEKAVFIFKNYEIFRIGLKSIIGISNIIKTTYELSVLAETILFHSIQYFLKKLSDKKGMPDSEVAVVLLGKLGGRELNFGSDLDIFIVYEKNGEISSGYYNSSFFNDLTAKTSKFLSYTSASGILYDVDLKLRPHGKNAPVVISANKLDDYLQKKGAVWEKLVYTKARVISKSNKFELKVKDIIDRFVYSPIDVLEFKKEVVHMRKRIVDNAVSKNGHNLFKKGKGGLLDLEFLAQYLNIIHGIENKYIRKKNIFNLYSSLYHYGIITLEDFKTAKTALIFLRNIETTLRIMTNYSHDKLPESKEERDKLAIKLGFSNTKAFMDKYYFINSQVSAIYKKFLLN